jgi:hypothetical protein
VTARHGQARHGALVGRPRLVEAFLVAQVLEPRLGARPGLLGSSEVDLLGALSDLG